MRLSRLLLGPEDNFPESYDENHLASAIQYVLLDLVLVIWDLLVPITRQIRLRSSYGDSRFSSDFRHNVSKNYLHDLKMF
jgi:hypothetical protein